MLSKFIAICLLLLPASCTHVSQISLNTGLGDELKPQDKNRTSATIGATTKFQNGLKIKTKYRHRLTDFNQNTMEHGFFIDASIPLWKNSKK